MASIAGNENADFSNLPIEQNRDLFVRDVVRELVGILQDMIGLDDVEGYVSIVGARIGQRMNAEYRALSDQEKLDVDHVAAALVDLKRRIDGGFSIESISDTEIVLSNTKCPFGAHVEGRPALCMMTSNVFGRIAADNLGYAGVHIEEAIARGDPGCRVIISLQRKPERANIDFREYFSQD